MKRFTTILLIVLLTCACSDKKFVEPFVQGSDEVGLEQRGNTIFTYNKSTCQLAFNRQNCTFRVQTDDMQDFFTITLSEMPTSLGQRVSGSLTWTTSSEVNIRKDIDFEVKKIEGDKLWLWAAAGKIGAVVRVLE